MGGDMVWSYTESYWSYEELIFCNWGNSTDRNLSLYVYINTQVKNHILTFQM